MGARCIMWNIEERSVSGAKVYVGDDMANEVLVRLELIIEEGAICILYDSHLGALAERLREGLKPNYRMFFKSVPSARSGEIQDDIDVPEYVRHVFAVGAGSAARAAKRLAARLNVDWSIYLTAPSTDTIMSDFPPKAVFIDKNVQINCPFDCIASGYGILLSAKLAAFERFFADKVLSDLLPAERAEKPTAEVSYELAPHELAFELLKSRGGDSASLIARILYLRALEKGRRPRLMGEYRFLASAMLVNFYCSLLGAPSIDIMPPACKHTALDRLAQLKFDVAGTAKKVDFFDINSYFRISYILSEYRMDLLEKLGGIDMRAAQRFWRRLYPDAGYWLKSEVSVKDMLEALTLAGALSDGLTGYAFASGALAINAPPKGSV